MTLFDMVIPSPKGEGSRPIGLPAVLNFFMFAKDKWGHNDYSMKVWNLSKTPPKSGRQEIQLI
jgi:hypothetical protein